MYFNELPLGEPLKKALNKRGYAVPTPIQEQAIPPILAGRDILATSQTGTGKTAAFSLPLLQKLSKRPRAGARRIRALILVPTRELACQTADALNAYGKYLPLRTEAVFGGVKINPQLQKLHRGVEILVATPGRLLDIYDKNGVLFPNLEMLILDEMDRILSMGFTREVQRILSLLPGKPQTLLFSATLPSEVKALATKLLADPLEIHIEPERKTAEPVEQWVYPVDREKKAALLIELIRRYGDQKILIFTGTKNGADHLVRRLEKKGIKGNAIHGDKSQGARTTALKEFKSGDANILIATDLASRGLDISRLPLVINYDLPRVKEEYIHRIGRTGRADRPGVAISLVCAEEFDELKTIERLTQQVIPRRIEEGFAPAKELPPSVLDTRPFKIKKPKKKKNPTGESSP